MGDAEQSPWDISEWVAEMDKWHVVRQAGQGVCRFCGLCQEYEWEGTRKWSRRWMWSHLWWVPLTAGQSRSKELWQGAVGKHSVGCSWGYGRDTRFKSLRDLRVEYVTWDSGSKHDLQCLVVRVLTWLEFTWAAQSLSQQISMLTTGKLGFHHPHGSWLQQLLYGLLKQVFPFCIIIRIW